MLFNSLIFIIFFTTTAILYWMLPGRGKNSGILRSVLLLVASIFFYCVYIPGYLLVLLLAVLMNFYLARSIENTKNGSKRKSLLTWGIILNVGLLAVFKYINPVLDLAGLHLNADSTLSFAGFVFQCIDTSGPVAHIITPLGISFFTFTNIACLIDVKRGIVPAERNLLHFSNYVTFFPKLIQGPIERVNHFMPQLKEPRIIDYNQVIDGLRLMLWGYFKKLVIADRLAVAVTAVFEKPANWNGPTLIFAAILFSFQIYFDFSAYVDIARGAAKVLGFELLKNFNMPYLARSIKEFWDRWHMTLSAWLREYIFLPVAYRLSDFLSKDKYLGINTDQYIYAVAAIVTFTIAGIWHGTGWNFIIWGELFAVYLIISNLTGKKKKKFYKRTGFYNIKWLYNPLQVLITFALVTFAWIFFASDSFTGAMTFLKGIPYGWSDLLHGRNLLPQFTFDGFSHLDLGLVILLIPFTIITQYYFYRKNFREIFISGPWIPMMMLRWGFYYSLLMFILLFGKFDGQSFIYFQF